MPKPNYCTVELMKSFVNTTLEGAADGLKEVTDKRERKLVEKIDVVYQSVEALAPIIDHVRQVKLAVRRIDARVARLEKAYDVDHRRLAEAHSLVLSLARNAQLKPKVGPVWTAPNLD